MKYTESNLENSTIQWLRDLGYTYIHGGDIAPDSDNPERKSYKDVTLEKRLRHAVDKFNPNIPQQARDEAVKKVLNVSNSSPTLSVTNYNFHKMLRDGIEVEFQTKDGQIRGDRVYLLDKKNVEANDWLVVNQFTVLEGETKRRPDVIVFLNGLPVAVFELKNPANEKTTVKKAFNQIQTYKDEIPSLFTYNEACVISDGFETKVGSVTANSEWFLKWKSIDGEKLSKGSENEMKVTLQGLFQKEKFLDVILNFNTFEKSDTNFIKKMAAYHQYFSTKKAVEKTKKAINKGDNKIGVIWHTQGSGKSLTMAFYTGRLVDELDNPTIVVITDRNDLDDQLYKTFVKSKGILRQTPVQAQDGEDLKEKLNVASGGIIFTTIQKFYPEKGNEFPTISERDDVIVIADEAHRSHYGLNAKVRKDEIIYGHAKYIRDALPNASFIGFTGTPIALKDRNTTAVFGNVIDTYDITRAVEDNTTVPIFYEARLAKILLDEDIRNKLDDEVNEILDQKDSTFQEKMKRRWTRLEAMVGSDSRLDLVAKDIVDHFEKRLSAIEGKGMIVTMSRRIAVELYKKICDLRPDWHSDSDDEGFLKVVMTGSASDPKEFQPHVRSKRDLEKIASRMKDAEDDMKLAIVVDMWLTGFDVPSMHTMYVDKPMKGHGLMQAIARVNRVYKDKQAGLIVDYIGIAKELKEALSYYTESDQKLTAIPQKEAVKVMLEKFEVVKDMFHDFDFQKYFKSADTKRSEILTKAVDYIFGLEDGAKRYKQAVSELASAFSVAVPHSKALEIRDEVAFFQAVLAGIRKLETEKTGGGPTDEDYEHAIKQLVNEAIVPDEVINIYDSAGLSKQNISILSDEFLEEVKGIEYKNLALEMLKKLLKDEIKTIDRKNVVLARKFSEMLENTLLEYQNRTIDSAQVVLDMIDLAKTIRGEIDKGKDLDLNEDEKAFYDALAENESAVREMGDEVLTKMAEEIAETIKKEATIDWTMRKSKRAKLRIKVKQLLKKYDYPPDKQERATKTVIEQAERVASETVE